MKRAKKGLAALLSICMLVTFLPASALAIGPEVGAEGLDEEAVAPVEEETEPVGEPAEPDNGAYSALKQAIEAASDGKETTVTLAGDIAGMTTEQIITIPENKNIILDMEGHSITVASDFTGRPIVNKGTLTVTGNGTIDASASKTGGYGAIDNYGTLTIENGTYTGSVDASGASIKNRPDSVLKIQDGTFNGAVTAVYNAGKTYIYDGTFAVIVAVGDIPFKAIRILKRVPNRNCISIMVLLLVYKGLFPHRQAIRKCGTASLKPWHAISTPMVVLRSMHCTLRENPVR